MVSACCVGEGLVIAIIGQCLAGFSLSQVPVSHPQFGLLRPVLANNLLLRTSRNRWDEKYATRELHSSRISRLVGSEVPEETPESLSRRQMSNLDCLDHARPFLNRRIVRTRFYPPPPCRISVLGWPKMYPELHCARHDTPADENWVSRQFCPG